MTGVETPPFPLDGGRVGDGGEASPTRPRHAPGATARAQRLRREQTYPERLVWDGVRKLKLNIRRQAPIGRFVVDFVHHESRLIVEIDGYHHSLPERQAEDAIRQDWLTSQGYRVLRFTTERVKSDLFAVLAEIERAVLSPPSQPFPHQGGRALWRARDQWVRDDEH